MLTPLLAPALHLTIIALLIAIASKYTVLRFNLKWVMISLLIFSSYWLVKVTGFEVITIKAFFPGLSWPWGAKLTLVICSLFSLVGLMLFKLDFKPSDAGFTTKQNSGSIKISLVVIGLLLLLRYYLSFLLGSDDGSRDPEELLFITTMHGIDHESFYRGVLLYTLSLGIISTRYIIFDAKIGIAGILLVILFALSLGVQYRGDGWFFFPVSLFFTGLHGLVYLWMRQRTGSLLLPIVAQSSVILFGQLLG